MRATFTIFLLILTAILCTWLVNDSLLRKWFNAPAEAKATPNGYPLYLEKDIIKTHHITVENKSSGEHRFSINRNFQWECTSPYQDRADGISYLTPLTQFALSAEIIDSYPVKDIDLADFSLEEQWTRITFSDKENQPLAKFKVGLSSKWHKRVITKDQRQQTITTDIPTLFVIKENTPDDQMLYLVTDPTNDLQSLFKNNFEGFRDHRPFALNRQAMEQVSIKRPTSEIVIDHSTSSSPWRISKPLDLATDSKKISTLLTHISALKANKLHPKEEITLSDDENEPIKISIKNRQIEEETTLTIFPNKESTTSYATVSDRPNIVFELPNLPSENNPSSIASIPETINEIRARNMLTLNRKNIRGFILKQSVQSPIIIARPKPNSEYQLLRANGANTKINEVKLSELIAALSVLPVKDFVTDAVTDNTLIEYQFHNPILEIAIRPFAGKSQKIIFSRKGGAIYAYSPGRSVLWEIDPQHFTKITKHEWEWNNNTLWSLLVNDIKSFTMELLAQPEQPTLNIQYDYIGDSFSGTLNNRSITQEINPIQAKFFLNNCHYIVAEKRLGPNNTAAKKALESPILKLTIASSRYDNDGIPTEETRNHTITIAKPNNTLQNPPFYYAKAEHDEDYLILSATTYQFLSTNIFSDE